MARYFDKRELVLIALLILLFDLNGFCDIVLPHILFKDKQTWILFVMVSVSLFVDIGIYRTELNSIPFEQVTFANNEDHNKKNCEEKIDIQISNLNNKIGQLKNKCNTEISQSYKVVEKMALTIIALIFVTIFVVAVTIDDANMDKRKYRILRGLPLLFFSGIILTLAYK
jgi:hypothetical protein